ncbi:MAG: SIMPL domain-containing protein, partial [Anaerolineales bacterium]
SVQGIHFQVSEIEYYREQARSMALEDAQLRAALMAAELEQEVGEPVTIQETATYFSNPYGYNPMLVTSNYDVAYLNLVYNESVVIFGEITVRSSVSVEFSLK